jgi:hypothetical protein
MIDVKKDKGVGGIEYLCSRRRLSETDDKSLSGCILVYEERKKVDTYQKRIFAFSEKEPSRINVSGLEDCEVDDRDVLVDGND